MGVAVRVKRVDVGLECLELVLDADPELLFFVDDQQAQLFELDALPHQGVRADQDVGLPGFDLFQRFGQRLARLESVDVVDGDGEIPEAPAEALEVLHRQDGRRHEDRHLLAVAGRAEGGADGDLGFAKPDVPTHQPVHRRRLQHVFTHGLARGVLVRRVLVHEAGFQRVLQVAVLGVGVPGRRLALGVELQEVVGDLLDPALGLLLGLGPGVGAQLVDFGLGAFLGAVFGNAMKAVDADVQHVAPTVGEADGLLHFPVDLNLVQAAELADAVVDVHHVVANFQRHQFLDRERFFVLAEPFLQAEAVVPLKQLVVRVDQHLEFLVHEAFAELHRNGLVRHRLFILLLPVVEDVVQALQLGGLAAHHHVHVPVLVVGAEVARNQVKLLVEGRLRRHPVLQNQPVGPGRAAPELHHGEGVEQPFQMGTFEVQVLGRRAFHLAAEPVVVRAGALHGFVEPHFATLRVGHPHDGTRRQEAEERFVGVVQAGVAHVGHHGGPRHLGHTQLRRRVKLADRVHVVPKKFDPVRVVEAVGEDVDDAAPHAVLARLVHEIHLLEFVRQEHLVEEVHGVRLAEGNRERLVAQFLAGDHLLGQRFRERHDNQPVSPAVDFVQHLGAHGDVGVFHRVFVRIRHAGGPWVEQDGPRVSQHRLQVVHEVRRLLLVVQDKHVVPRVGHLVLVAEHPGNGQGNGGPHGAVHLHFGALGLQGTTKAPCTRVTGVELKKVCGAHGPQSYVTPAPCSPERRAFRHVLRASMRWRFPT